MWRAVLQNKVCRGISIRTLLPLFFSPRTRFLCGKTNFVFLRIPPKLIMKAATVAAILLAVYLAVDSATGMKLSL